MFGHPLDAETVANLRLADPKPALGNEHFHTRIERMMGKRREARRRGWRRIDVAGKAIEGQRSVGILPGISILAPLILSRGHTSGPEHVRLTVTAA